MNAYDLLSLAKIFAQYHAISQWAVSYRCLKKGDFFSHIAAGSSCTIKTYSRVLQWFSDHWPAGLQWPMEIQRPLPDIKNSLESTQKSVTDSGKARNFCHAPITNPADIDINLAEFARRHGWQPATVRQVVRRYCVSDAEPPKYGSQTFSILAALTEVLGREIAGVNRAAKFLAVVDGGASPSSHPPQKAPSSL